ncbi:MAG: UDP-4-amino-4,6-dideoxy-N-acetyl-beta-L-altrosamine transaminase [Gemmatimonadetes bacterium]|nr:UDP-4-amino-4,6-dideoxy-N-acetyl-beta-L-altrosamine transaminase [Gemmatimonadota bacterium]
MSGQYIPYGCQWIDEEDIQAVAEVLRSDLITQGPMIQRFEEALAEFCGATYAVAVSSGTAALHLACLAAGVGPGYEVVTSPNTFVASANCALYCGAVPRFVDIDPLTYNLSPGRMEEFLAKTSGPDIPRAVIPVHFAGQPCQMEQIWSTARSHSLIVIEDACHALGARWQDSNGTWQRVGSCSHSDMAVLSFHPVKHITTGEGGAVLLNNESLYRDLLDLRTHGITKDTSRMERNDGPWYYEMQSLGYNYRITDLQCALGLRQLGKVGSWVSRRREIAALYDEAFSGIQGLLPPFQMHGTEASFHLYVPQVAKDLIVFRNEIFDKLHTHGIGTQIHYIPVHFQPYYRQHFGYSEGDFPMAEEYYRRCFTLPVFPSMKDEEVQRIADIVLQLVAEYGACG